VIFFSYNIDAGDLEKNFNVGWQCNDTEYAFTLTITSRVKNLKSKTYYYCGALAKLEEAITAKSSDRLAIALQTFYNAIQFGVI
jgi:hypothetical protein